MKNNDSSLLSGSKQAVDYMVREITHICRNMKKRAPGSEGEREAAEYMADILKKECGCSDIRIESFDVSSIFLLSATQYSFRNAGDPADALPVHTIS